MADTPPAALPTGYLLRNFQHVADWVVTLYPDLLSTEEADFYRQFQQLGIPAQHLFLRLLTRTRQLIPAGSLSYAEVPHIASALAELVTKGFAELNPRVDAAELLQLQTKSTLLAAFTLPVKSSAKKTIIIDAILTQHDDVLIHQTLAQIQPWVTALQKSRFELFLLLFFGNGQQDLSEFVITELGHVRYEPYNICHNTRYFSCRADVDTLQHYLAAREQLENESITQDALALQVLFSQLPSHRQQAELHRRYDKIALTIARQLERLNELDAALEIYQQVQTHPSHERQVRILAKQQQTELALQLCVDIVTHSRHPEALEFAEQFGSKIARQQAVPFPTSPAPEIDVTQQELHFTGESVEIVAARALSDENHQCIYVENTLFCGLFGLLFWDIIFAPVPGAFFHPFQYGPRHLRSEYFYADRADLIEQRLAAMDNAGWQALVWQHFETRQGITNQFVVWETLSPSLLERAMTNIPAKHLQFIVRQLAQHPGLYGNGFPDLIRFSAQGYELIEVKAPNDRLQPNQRRWFRRFAVASIPARLMNVTWIEHAYE